MNSSEIEQVMCISMGECVSRSHTASGCEKCKFRCQAAAWVLETQNLFGMLEYDWYSSNHIVLDFKESFNIPVINDHFHMALLDSVIEDVNDKVSWNIINGHASVQSVRHQFKVDIPTALDIIKSGHVTMFMYVTLEFIQNNIINQIKK